MMGPIAGHVFSSIELPGKNLLVGTCRRGAVEMGGFPHGEWFPLMLACLAGGVKHKNSMVSSKRKGRGDVSRCCVYKYVQKLRFSSTCRLFNSAILGHMCFSCGDVIWEPGHPPSPHPPSSIRWPGKIHHQRSSLMSGVFLGISWESERVPPPQWPPLQEIDKKHNTLANGEHQAHNCSLKCP